MEIRVITDDHQFTALEKTWCELHKLSSKPELCNSWEWLHSWWNTFKETNWKLHIYCVYTEQQLVAIVPYYSRKEAGTISLYLMGKGEPEETEICSEFVDIIVTAGLQQEVIQTLAKHQSQTLNSIKQVQLDQIEETSLLHKLWSATHCYVQTKRNGVRYQVPLGQDVKTTLKTLPSSNLSKKALRLLNRFLDNSYQIDTFSQPDEFDSAWPILQRLHEIRWKANGKKGAFVNDLFYQFHRRYFDLIAPGEGAKILIISKANEHKTAVAAIYCFYCQGQIYYYQSGIDTSCSGSPGILAHIAVLLTAADEYHSYDFMRGGEISYKKSWASKQTPIINLTAFPRSSSGALRYYTAQGMEQIRDIKRSIGTIRKQSV
ncbi:GNAT family N-acetyltransferase [Motiliproteus sp. MSK22-1]|uniref:GNAT family N-acetyltransferase n=1 Tax=Motiliproteus sp. MSK22-1 TaxID=1897630 RepID=UPI000975C72F|nr:GNAT family N-acetyltransferase [Motiliproteus sp. MSK22-1]OMH25665.1 hypothetical protein BGP75_24285 [Motiliproteus sp. MSK22-1]